MDYLKLYQEQLKQDDQKVEDQLMESLEQLDEVAILTAVGVAMAAGAIFRIIDGIRGNKPKVRHYLKGIITWAFSEYSDGTLSINAIRKAAYDTMKEDQEIEDEFGPSSSKILTRKLLKSLKKGSKSANEALGNAIGRIAKRAKMSVQELDKAIKTVDL